MKQMGFHWITAERTEFLDRLCYIAGDPVSGYDLRVLVRLYNRELLGRRSAKLREDLHAPL